jgi:protein-tyrosine phosphatase
MAFRDGIRTLVATPHTLNGVYYNDGETILRAVGALWQRLERMGVHLDIAPASDVHVYPDIPQMIQDGHVMTINNTGRAVILEFPDYFVPDFMCRFLESLVKKGIVPVVSHPERMSQFTDLGLLREMIELGALTQVTAMSLTGGFGPRVRNLTRTFLEKALVHVIASDAHSADGRPPILSRAVAEASRILGEERAMVLVNENPEAILKGNRPSEETVQPVSLSSSPTPEGSTNPATPSPGPSGHFS